MSNNIFEPINQDSLESSDPTQTFKCTNCKNQFLITDRDNHELICMYSLKIKTKDIDDIPCEKCGKTVSFDEYASHLNMCGLDQSLINDIYMNMRMDNQPSYNQYSFIRPIESNNKKSDSEQSKKRPKRDNTDNLLSSQMTNIFQHIGNLLSKTDTTDIISSIEDELDIHEPTIEDEIDIDEPTIEDELGIDEPTIEQTHIDTDDDINENNFEKKIQLFNQTNQSNTNESISSTLDKSAEIMPSLTTLDEPVTNISQIDSHNESSDITFDDSELNMEKVQPNIFRTSDNNGTRIFGQLITGSSFNINHNTLGSMLSSTSQTQGDFIRLPDPINQNHRSELNNLYKYLSRETNNNFMGRSPRRNIIPNTSFGLSDEQMSYLPPDLRAMMDIVNASNLSNRKNYIPMSNRRYNQEENESYEELKSLCDKTGVVELGVSNIDVVAPFIELEDGMTCAICDTNEPEKKYRKIICGHPDIFCDECATKWLSKNKACPVCTNNIEDYYINMMTEDELSIIEKELDLIDTSEKTNL
jgi:hypothetical protein